jgi:hypothetical protein
MNVGSLGLETSERARERESEMAIHRKARALARTKPSRLSDPISATQPPNLSWLSCYPARRNVSVSPSMLSFSFAKAWPNENRRVVTGALVPKSRGGFFDTSAASLVGVAV